MGKVKVVPTMFENGNHDGLHARHLKTVEILTPKKYPNLSESPKNPELKKIFEELKVIADKMRDENLTSEYEEEWKYAAIVVDRFLSQWVSDIIYIFRISAIVFLSALVIAFFTTVCVGAAQN